jgi:hypothetical protein
VTFGADHSNDTPPVVDVEVIKIHRTHVLNALFAVPDEQVVSTDNREAGEAEDLPAVVILVLIDNSGSCAGKWLYNNRLWFCSREFTTLKGIIASGRVNVPPSEGNTLTFSSCTWPRRIHKISPTKKYSDNRGDES